MTLWILAVLGLWVAQTFLPSTVFYVVAPKDDKVRFAREHMRGRDDMPPDPPLVARAKRAQANMAEAMPVFLGLALLHVALGDVPDLAVTGAMVFFVGRLLYAPSYLLAAPGLRSAVWSVGLLGLAMMLWPLLQGLL